MQRSQTAQPRIPENRKQPRPCAFFIRMAQERLSVRCNRGACMKRVNWRWLILSLFIAGGFQMRSEAQTVTITIDANKKAGFEIPQTIFGSFLEPIGNSTYNGLWAEILQNPSFESGLWSASNIARMIRDQPTLAKASQLGLPIPWEPLDPQEGNRYEPRREDAANSWQSLAIFGEPGKETGVKQRVFLPIHRELHYIGSIYAKHLSGPSALDISLRKADAAEQV